MFFNLDPGTGIRDGKFECATLVPTVGTFPTALKQFFELKILTFFDADLESF